MKKIKWSISLLIVSSLLVACGGEDEASNVVEASTDDSVVEEETNQEVVEVEIEEVVEEAIEEVPNKDQDPIAYGLYHIPDDLKEHFISDAKKVQKDKDEAEFFLIYHFNPDSEEVDFEYEFGLVREYVNSERYDDIPLYISTLHNRSMITPLHVRLLGAEKHSRLSYTGSRGESPTGEPMPTTNFFEPDLLDGTNFREDVQLRLYD